MARIEGIAEQAERDRELKRAELETDRESKLSSEIEAPQYFYTDRSKAVLLLWFLSVLAVCVYLWFIYYVSDIFCKF